MQGTHSYIGYREPTRRAGLVIAGVALALASGAAFAGLYPPAAPPGSAFVRVFNATTQPHLTGSIGDKQIRDVPAYGASSYLFLSPGSYPAQIGSASTSLTLSGSHCYTAALTGGGIHLFDQPCFNSQIKALVALYNVEDGAKLSLRTADGKTSVIKGVASGHAGHRAVNAISATFAVFDGDKKLSDAKPVSLQRGKAFSLFVTGSPAQPNLVWVVN